MCALNMHKPILPSERFLNDGQADECVKWLKRQGFSVLSIQKGHVCARINIRPSPLCEKLEGVVSAFEHPINEAPKRYSYVYRFGFEVRWEDGSVQ